MWDTVEVHNFVHADKITTNSSTDQRKELEPLEGCLVWDVAQPLYKLHREAILGDNGGRMLVLHIQEAGE